MIAQSGFSLLDYDPQNPCDLHALTTRTYDEGNVGKGKVMLSRSVCKTEE